MKVKEKMIGGVTMAQNLTYTRCGDYLIPDIQLSTQAINRLGNMEGCAERFLQKTIQCSWMT